PTEGVEALNAANGDLLWSYARAPAKNATFRFKRMLAISGERIFLATTDLHLVALDMRSGKQVWDHAVAGDGAQYTSGPMALNGKIIIGATSCVTSRCFI